MAHIYVITNQINNKQYVGKTIFSIQKRWNEHKQALFRKRNEKRPLYEAMSKYGIDNFKIEELEECLPDEANIQEQYWIKKLNTFHNGYNVTLGGDGKHYLDYSKILKLFDETLLNITEIATICSCCEDSVKNIVSQYRENVNWRQRHSLRQLPNNLGITGKTVRCIEEQKEFPSATRAANWLVENGRIKSQSYGRSKIPMACRGERNTVGSYHWEYI